jgi:anthranilate phosphoribosyltransferase
MIREAIAKLAGRTDLSVEESYAAMNDIMAGKVTDSQIAGFLMALRVKGETVEEVAGCAKAMREHATVIRATDPRVIDTCGTGGDASGTFNISTTAAIIASAAGATVAKHGNRAVSSRCGSADVLKALGVNIDLEPERAERVLNEVGITFLFAPLMHAAMKHAMNARKELAVRTIFNILGPLTNPAGARRQVVGVFEPRLTELMAGVLKQLGAEHAFVAHGEGGLDEFSTVGSTRVSELKNGAIKTYNVRAIDLKLNPATLESLQGGDIETNVGIVRGILDGKAGALRDVAILNAGAALVVAGQASSLADGVEMAREVIENGSARRQLARWAEATRS